jgi:[ribosomal protein S5]-alanine N-acetyltransferase
VNPLERIDTARLVLRKPRLDDADSIFESYARDPEVTRHLTWLPHKSSEETRRILQRMLDGWSAGTAYPYALTLKDEDAVIGMIAMHPDGFKVEIGYVLARSRWGNGYMTEALRAVVDWALQQPGVHRIFATCGVENPASARVLEKSGMQREGLLRKYIVHPNRGDEPRDSYIYSIVKT